MAIDQPSLPGLFFYTVGIPGSSRRANLSRLLRRSLLSYTPGKSYSDTQPTPTACLGLFSATAKVAP